MIKRLKQSLNYLKASVVTTWKKTEQKERVTLAFKTSVTRKSLPKLEMRGDKEYRDLFPSWGAGSDFDDCIDFKISLFFHLAKYPFHNIVNIYVIK